MLWLEMTPLVSMIHIIYTSQLCGILLTLDFLWVQPSQQHVAPCVKGVELGRGSPTL